MKTKSFRWVLWIMIAITIVMFYPYEKKENTTTDNGYTAEYSDIIIS